MKRKKQTGENRKRKTTNAAGLLDYLQVKDRNTLKTIIGRTSERLKTQLSRV